MEIKDTRKDGFVLLEIYKNGSPASAQNPIKAKEYKTVEFPRVTGGLAIISGMPTSAVALLTAHYKNLFSALAIANPRDKVAEIIHSVSADYEVGNTVPLELE